MDLEIDDNDGKWGVVAKKLIRMTLIYDLGDEVGRQNLCKLIKDLLTSGFRQEPGDLCDIAW